jgi:hypothetical protein
MRPSSDGTCCVWTTAGALLLLLGACISRQDEHCAHRHSYHAAHDHPRSDHSSQRKPAPLEPSLCHFKGRLVTAGFIRSMRLSSAARRNQCFASGGAIVVFSWPGKRPPSHALEHTKKGAETLVRLANR